MEEDPERGPSQLGDLLEGDKEIVEAAGAIVSRLTLVRERIDMPSPADKVRSMLRTTAKV
jgi:hypothetical protein